MSGQAEGGVEEVAQLVKLLTGQPFEPLDRIDAVVISHEHYDHCDLDALVDGGFDLGVPLFAPGTVTAIATAEDFRDVRTIEAWESDTAGELTVTAAPGQHGVGAASLRLPLTPASAPMRTERNSPNQARRIRS